MNESTRTFTADPNDYADEMNAVTGSSSFVADPNDYADEIAHYARQRVA